LKSEYRHTASDGRRYKETDVTGAKPGGDTSYVWRVKRGSPQERWEPDLTDEFRQPKAGVQYLAVKPYEGRFWAYSKPNLIQFWEDGKLIHRKTGMPRLMQFADEMPGVSLQELWAGIDPINAVAHERVGYPTQKPLPLLERIIKASSGPDDIVLDAFCGCGTALVAAQRLDRRWIGIDISPTACKVMAQRLKEDCKLNEGTDFVVRDLPRDEAQLRAMPYTQFEDWAVIALGGVPNKTKTGDKGIDGRIFPVSALPTTKQKKANDDLFDPLGPWYPIQVKQKDRVDRPDIDKFETVMNRENREKGFFVAFGFTDGAKREIDAFFRREHKTIIHITVRDILEEELAMKLA
jgi:hypothetical protein